MESFMSLAARKSDLKNHLSRNVKKHLNLFPAIDLPNDTALAREGVSVDGNSSNATMDLGSRPPAEALEPPKAADR
jgi:hypothetical protein